MKKIILSFLLLNVSNLYADYSSRIKNCSPGAKKELSRVRKFLTENIDEVLDKTADLTRKEMKKIKKRLKKIKIRCSDQKAFCKGKTLGMERSLFNIAVDICYRRHQQNYDNNAFCKLADTVIHEIGHSAGVKKDPKHNEGTFSDRVYRLGFGGSDLCEEMGLDRRIAPR